MKKMNNNKTECVKCFGLGETMEAKETRGFEYKQCNLCKGEGVIFTELADDYIFSLNEENFEEE